MAGDLPALNGCEWLSSVDGSTCTFDPEKFRARAFKGKRLCFAHRPEYDGIKTLQSVHAHLEEYRTKAQSLESFVFPVVPEDQNKSLQVGGLKLSRSEFLGQVQLHFGGRPVDLSHAIFRRRSALSDVGGIVCLDSAQFFEDLSISGTHSGKIAMRDATCNGQVVLRTGGTTPGPFASIDFRNSTFHEVPVLSPNHLPQDARFYGARFVGNAAQSDSEARHRALRVAFAANSDREMEGFFYSHEKRCHRRSLTWRRSAVAKAVSWLYGMTSNYGYSYERALGWLAVVQLAFGAWYSALSDRWAWLGTFDSKIAIFTIGQVVRPFEPFAARAPTSSVYHEILKGNEASGWWILTMTAHSVISLALFALMLLALRWRFRRE